MTEHPHAPPRRSRLIVGCGYLGLRVASRWLAAGDMVFATTRSPRRVEQLTAAGLHPLLGDVTAAADTEAGLPEPPAVDTVLWAVGFDRSAAASYQDVHVAGLGRLLDRLPGRPRIIFTSSTGVWGDDSGGLVNEMTPPTPSREAGQVLVAAEELLRNHRLGPGIALRLAGLYGPERLPRLTDLQAGRPLPADPDSWLNLIHIDDAAEVVCGVAALPAPRQLYVVSDGSPLRRRDWYEGLARIAGSPEPQWDRAALRSRGGDKQVDPRLIWADLQFGPRHPDALAAVRDLL
jgi:nucleoside-diphosphate-sugar epimerase